MESQCRVPSAAAAKKRGVIASRTGSRAKGETVQGFHDELSEGTPMRRSPPFWRDSRSIGLVWGPGEGGTGVAEVDGGDAVVDDAEGVGPQPVSTVTAKQHTIIGIQKG